MMIGLIVVYIMLKMISGAALMTQSYLVTEQDNERLNANPAIFQWFVTALAGAIDSAVYDRRWRGFSVIEVTTVGHHQPTSLLGSRAFALATIHNHFCVRQSLGLCDSVCNFGAKLYSETKPDSGMVSTDSLLELPTAYRLGMLPMTSPDGMTS